MQGFTSADSDFDGMTVEQQHEWLANEMLTLPLEDLQKMRHFINAASADDTEEMYQCWRERLDEYGYIPEELLDNEFVKRYLAEKVSPEVTTSRSRYDG